MSDDLSGTVCQIKSKLRKLTAATRNTRVLIEAMGEAGEVAKRAFEAMMEMQKIDVTKIEAAVRGEVAPT